MKDKITIRYTRHWTSGRGIQMISYYEAGEDGKARLTHYCPSPIQYPKNPKN